MPTFSAIQLDRLLEPGYTTTTNETTSLKQTPNTDKVLEDVPPKLHRRNTTSLPFDRLNVSFRNSVDIPPPHPQLRRRNSASNDVDVKVRPPQVRPALYATPDPAPLPLSPTPSYDASPFLVNHKRRGPRFVRSFSHHNDADATEQETLVPLTRNSSEELVPPLVELNGGETVVLDDNRCANGDIVMEKAASLERDGGSEMEVFFDPQESMSYSSSLDAVEYGAERSARTYNTPIGEFYDAWEELSFNSGRQPAPRSLGEIEIELRETRLSLLMEIEKSKQAEETVNTMRLNWGTLREELRAVGFNLPVGLEAMAEDIRSGITLTEEICRQIHLARFVSESIGRGSAKAEVEADMEAQLEMKNFEIARLCDRLHYYETMNREMSQRNQEAVEIARCERLKRRRRQKWVWGSIATALTLGTAALAWSYLPDGKGSSSTEFSESTKPDRDVQ